MSFETNLNDITLILDLFKQEEYLFFHQFAILILKMIYITIMLTYLGIMMILIK